MKSGRYIYYILIGIIIITAGLYAFMHRHADILHATAVPAPQEEKQGTPIPEPVVVAGEYIVTKNATIIPKDPKGNKKVVLITVDDGPSMYSAQIMNIFNKHHIKAIFFINGNHHKKNPDAIKNEFAAGFPIGNHTWDHQNLKKISEAEAIKEIDDNTKLITEVTGKAPLFFRPPYGVSTPFVREYVKKNNMIYMNWTGSALDWEKTAHEENVFIKNVEDGLRSGEIILLHEHEWTVAYLDKLLTNIEQKGYSFVDPNNIVQ